MRLKHLPRYTAMDVLMASPTEPLSKEKQTYHLTVMWQALASIEHDPEPTRNDWRICSDAVNILSTLVAKNVLEDSSGLIMDAVNALLAAGERSEQGKPIRLDGPGIRTVRAVLEDYASAIQILPARAVLAAHRKTEQTVQMMRKQAGNRKSGPRLMRV